MPPSPLTPLSSPLPQIPSPSLPLPSPPTHTSLTYAEALLGYRAAMIQWRVASPSTHHPSEIPSPPLLLPSTTHRDDLPEEDMRFRRELISLFSLVDASIRAAESRAMTAIGEVNERVTDLDTTLRQETHELQVRCEDAQDNRALLRAYVSLLTRERRYFYSMASSYEREAVIARQAWVHSESRSHAMEAQIRAFQRNVDVLQRQMIRDEDRLVSHIQHEHDRFTELVCTAEEGPQDGLADAGSSC
ncbi:hypothetical protein Tco_0228601 [Tanacetum coccineum]